MEVHHHSHTARKKWTHYFWEFLMLFLAVFCGFLAENQREHIVEAHRAKEYAKGLYLELKHDTADIQRGIRQIGFLTSVLDTLGSLATRYKDKNNLPGHFYYYSRLSGTSYSIDWSRSSLNQLILSGNLRYFRNKELVDNINRYYSLQASMDRTDMVDDRQREKIRELRNKILSNSYFSIFVRDMAISDISDHKWHNQQIDSLQRLMLPLQKGGEQYMDEYLNNINERAVRFSTSIILDFSKSLQLATTILKQLESEYHFK